MAGENTRAAWRKFKGNYTRGRLVVSEDPITPAETLYPDIALPTLFYDYEDDRREILIVQGTILTLYVDTSSGGLGINTPVLRPSTEATVPFAVSRMDLLRPFDYGDSQIASYVRRGYIEVPLVSGTVCPTQSDRGYTGSPSGTIWPGDFVKSDSLGRFVKMTSGDALELKVGQVVSMEQFGTTYDTGMLEYYKWDTGAFKNYLHTLTETDPYLHTADWDSIYNSASSPFLGQRGIRQNLDVKGSIGSMRIWLTL